MSKPGPVPVDRQLLQRILDYLVERPYKDVAQVLQDLGGALQEANKAQAQPANGKNRVKELSK